MILHLIEIAKSTDNSQFLIGCVCLCCHDFTFTGYKKQDLSLGTEQEETTSYSDGQDSRKGETQLILVGSGELGKRVNSTRVLLSRRSWWQGSMSEDRLGSRVG